MNLPTRKVLLASMFVMVALATVIALATWESRSGGVTSWGLWVTTVVVALIVGVAILAGDDNRRFDVRRTTDDPTDDRPLPVARAEHPYRSALKRLVVPPVSATWTAGIAGVALLISSVLVPLLLRLPGWVEVDRGDHATTHDVTGDPGTTSGARPGASALRGARMMGTLE